ncbi:MAG: response regulator [Gammaproteobacteria bacterium]|nr:response regulator [Gammaproteobacteria bacterium]
MSNWGIRQHIITLALLPVLVVAIVLTSYFTLSQLSFLSDSQIQQGNIIARQLAPASEYAVFSGNISSLNPILENTLSDNDIIGIKITNENNEVLISVNDADLSQQKKSIWHQLASEELTTFREAIKTQTLDINLPDTANNAVNNENIIGYIEITLSSTNINAKKIQAIAKGSLITLFVLLASMTLAIRLSKKISQPVNTLTNTVKKISSGDYKARIKEQAPGDIGILESCVNIMASELQSSRDNLEEKIDESTKELHETMEELEIRNAELDIARSNAIQASKAKTEFLANMSHELRTPLGGILGFSELLESTELESQQRDYSEIIKKSASNLLNIIDDVLDLSKIESGKLEINFSEFNTINIVEEVIDLLIPIAYEKDLELFYYIDEGTPNIINSDPVRIRQILINLLGNAIKFTENGVISLHISSHKEHDSSTQLIFSITDTGIGMNQVQQDRLFNAFTQADKTIERKFGGTGLGLVISKKLSQMLNGDITFESQHNKGSIFTLKISVENTEQEYDAENSLLNKKICFIDPHCSCEKGIQSMLKIWGCNISNFNTIPEDSSIYDLIIVSICRSGMSIKQIKSLIPSSNIICPLLAIVSTRSHKDLRDIKSYGFNDAIFRSSKHELINQSLTKLINHDVDKIQTTPSTPSTPSTPDNLFDWSSLSILIVDDNDINLKLAEIILKKNGAQAITAKNGQQAIDLLDNHHFDLIFMDLQMPELDGYETSRLIRKNKNNDGTIIIALTANAMATKESEKFKQCGINDVLIKPFNEACIQNTIDQWILKNNTHQSIKQIKNETEFFSKIEALELAAGNIQLANELTNMLINELPEHLQIINDALSKDDIEQLRQQTHKLHGATRCCGTLALRNAAEQLESDIDNGILERLAPSTHQLTNEIERLININHAELLLQDTSD